MEIPYERYNCSNPDQYGAFPIQWFAVVTVVIAFYPAILPFIFYLFYRDDHGSYETVSEKSRSGNEQGYRALMIFTAYSGIILAVLLTDEVSSYNPYYFQGALPQGEIYFTYAQIGAALLFPLVGMLPSGRKEEKEKQKNKGKHPSDIPEKPSCCSPEWFKKNFLPLCRCTLFESLPIEEDSEKGECVECYPACSSRNSFRNGRRGCCTVIPTTELDRLKQNDQEIQPLMNWECSRWLCWLGKPDVLGTYPACGPCVMSSSVWESIFCGQTLMDLTHMGTAVIFFVVNTASNLYFVVVDDRSTWTFAVFAGMCPLFLTMFLVAKIALAIIGENTKQHSRQVQAWKRLRFVNEVLLVGVVVILSCLISLRRNPSVCWGTYKGV